MIYRWIVKKYFEESGNLNYLKLSFPLLTAQELFKKFTFDIENSLTTPLHLEIILLVSGQKILWNIFREFLNKDILALGYSETK